MDRIRIGNRIMTTTTLVLSAFLVSCSGFGHPSRGFTAEDLLLTQEMVPQNWKRTQVVPVSVAVFGFGNEELDRQVGFVEQSDLQDRVIADHFVLVFRGGGRAANWYEDKMRSEFNDNSIAITGTWSTHPDLTYEPAFPGQYRVACAINNIAGEQLVLNCCTVSQDELTIGAEYLEEAN
jgi:hypothetical protein